MGRALDAVFFDLDGTLLDSTRAWRSALADVAAGYSVAVTDAFHARTAGLTAEDALRLVYQEAGLAPGDAEFGRTLSVFQDGALSVVLRDPVWVAGGERLIRRLRRCSVPVGLVTSSSCALVNRLLQAPGAPVLDVVVCREDVACPKPAPDPYREAARRLGVPAAATVAVEDSPAGAESARRAGCAVLAVGPRSDRIEAEARVSHLSEVTVGLLRALMAVRSQEASCQSKRY